MLLWEQDNTLWEQDTSNILWEQNIMLWEQVICSCMALTCHQFCLLVFFYEFRKRFSSVCRLMSQLSEDSDILF